MICTMCDMLKHSEIYMFDSSTRLLADCVAVVVVSHIDSSPMFWQ